MRAAFYEKAGPAEEVLVLGDMAEPEVGPGEVRVRMQWSGINPSDVKARSGARGPALPFARIVPHSDGMGIIDSVGAGVDPACIGRRVWLWNAGWGRPFGTAADFISGSSGNRVGDLAVFQSSGSMQVRILRRRYSSSRSPYARRWMTRILLLSPSTKPSETLFSGLQ